MLLVSTIGSIGAAHADPIAENSIGIYTAQINNSPDGVWELAPCDDGADRCVKVSQFGVKDKNRKKPNWSANAHWAVGSWSFSRVATKYISCEDGSKHDVVLAYSWDAATNEGFRSRNDPGLCGKKPASYAVPLMLVKTGPLPTPAPPSP